MPAPTARTPTPSARRRAKEAEQAETPEGETPPDMDDDDMENNVSLSAMEAELKPRVETFNAIADDYKKLRRLQDQDIANRLENTSSRRRRSASTRSSRTTSPR
jgi:RNA polymerase primary sigma factor